MKAVIAQCLSKLLKEKFGAEKHNAIMEKAGFNKYTVFVASQNLEDAKVMELVQATCEVLGITGQQACEVFGEYWVYDFASCVYTTYFQAASSSREFLEKMDEVHLAITRNLPDAKPPRFSVENKDENTIVMNYNSVRGLIDIMVGSIRGVGKYYKEKLEVTKLSDTQVQVQFPV